MKIDIFAHIIPGKYLAHVNKSNIAIPDYIERTRSLFDLETRFRIMDKYDEYVQVLTIPGFHRVIAEGNGQAIEIAKKANDEIAELITKYPDRFVAEVASLPL